MTRKGRPFSSVSSVLSGKRRVPFRGTLGRNFIRQNAGESAETAEGRRARPCDETVASHDFFRKLDTSTESNRTAVGVTCAGSRKGGCSFRKCKCRRRSRDSGSVRIVRRNSRNTKKKNEALATGDLSLFSPLILRENPSLVEERKPESRKRKGRREMKGVQEENASAGCGELVGARNLRRNLHRKQFCRAR